MNDLKKRAPLYEQIYENLRESIISGEIQANERLIDSSIAEKLKVSRSPVREAFRKLEQEGLIINEDGISRVYNPTLQDILEIFQVRVGLEEVAVYWATKHINKDNLDKLADTLVHVEKALKENDLAKAVTLNTFFHEHIIQCSGNARLMQIMCNINTLTRLYRTAYFNKFYGSDDFLKEHRGILEAMIAREPEIAAQKMQAHITNDMNYLMKQFS